ncbi:MAG TPA: cytochrome c nitrite reductase small subunit [Verrucomicrobia bacterium]|nr:MAG: cytochrome c nitrite reductase small subunit [Lentisphaerae bacterium GWF2_57_35]HBA85633.1 cytochrome c nitrite reductase small subunit [Verrucomicrobiota bacterium]
MGFKWNRHFLLNWCLLTPLPIFWRIGVFVLLGVAIGLGAVIVRISRMPSYLSDAPEVCINCHVMNSAYATWRQGSHGPVALCVDCHLPHDNFVAKMAFKAYDGMKHSYVFTFRLEPQVLELSPAAVHVVQGNCVRCHYQQFQMIRLADSTERKCWDCHDGAHGAVISLSASPFAHRPQLPSAGLDWMKHLSKENSDE